MAFDDLHSDSSYEDGGPPLQPNTTSRDAMKLRDASRLKRPVRYVQDNEPIDPGRPIFVHDDPVFNKDRAHFVQWPTLELNEPSPGEARYKLWQEQGEPRDEFGKPVVPSSPSRGDVDVASPPGPTVAHLKCRQLPSARPDLSRSLLNTVEQKDAFDEAFDRNLAEFEDDESHSGGDGVSRVVRHKFSPQIKDWSALSENVQWAIICDLAHDHRGGITDAANLLSLNMTEVINFVNLYLREKALWENGAPQDDSGHSARALAQRDGAQDEDVQPVLEAEVDYPWQDLEEPDPAGFFQTVNDTEVSSQGHGRVADIWQEPEEELFLGADNVAAEEPVKQPDTVNQPGRQADEVQASFEGTPPPVDLVTDRFSREDIASGRSYLNFVGLPEYADRFGEWFGTGTWFREIPGIFDENNELIFPTEDTNEALYNGNELDWQGPAPHPLEGLPQREWLTEALPQGGLRPERPEDLELQQFQAVAERISGHPIRSHRTGDVSSNQTPQGVLGHLNLVERAQTGTFAQMNADDDLAGEEAADLIQNEAEKGFRADSNGTQLSSKSYGQHGNLVPTGTPETVLGEGAQLFNTKTAIPNSPSVPRRDNGIVHNFPVFGHVGSDGGFDKHNSVPPSNSQSSHQLPSVSLPHHGIVQPAGKAAPASSLSGHDSSQIKSTGETTQAQTKDASIAMTDSTGSPSVKASSYHEARGTAKKVKQDPQVAVTQSESQEPDDSGRFSQNGIDTDGFPKCAPCFASRARCDGGRPCSTCGSRNRRCKDVTKADLDKYPDRAERLIADRAKASAKAAQGEGQVMIRSPASTPNAATPAPALSIAKTTGVRHKYSATARDTSFGKDDSDLDQYPSEKEDPEDGDYDHTPKKKRPKKGSTPAIKKKATAKGAPAASTPTKKGSRGPYKKKARDSALKDNDDTKNTLPPQPDGSASSDSAVAVTKARKNPEKAPAAEKDKPCDLSLNTDEVDPSETGARLPVHNAAKAVRQASAGMTNVRPVPVGQRSEMHGVLNPSLAYPSLSDAENSPYLDASFAPVAPQIHPRMTPVHRPITGFPGVYPSQGAFAMPGIPSHVMLPRHQTIATENNHLNGAMFPASNFYGRTALHDTLPVTGEGMSAMPQSRPGLSGSPGPTDVSPTSQSSGSGTTASMDFLAMPFSPMQGSPAYSHYGHGGMPGRNPQGSPGSSTGFPAGMVSLGSPTVPQRHLSGSSHSNGAPGPVTGVTSPLTSAAPGFAVSSGLMPPYAAFPDSRRIPRPVSRLQYGYQGRQQSGPPFSTSGMFRDHQGEGVRSGSRGFSDSPSQQQQGASPRPPKRMADASSDLGQQPSRKKPGTSNSPQAPPRDAKSWQELARTQWANDSQSKKKDAPHPSAKPFFGGDGSFEVSFRPFSQPSQPANVQEQIDPVLKEMEKAQNISPRSPGPSKNR
ncbi:hypothetical protein KVR01_002157 [Diaporthe batatas]|uniref:uncharacterized protein n=1 Tax=Diaporthe batatas TaxID=748121 RepID=UPI001D04A89E|nr:uncharacterized protein KVR01_002157 [Diaporthe batatas]KAG8166468.1 hypothetical protein KVR01_002157 [Diaporthe batatas]